MVSLSIPLILLSALHGLLPADAEQADVRRWAAARFEGMLLTAEPLREGIEVVSNHGPVQSNARGGEPLLLASEQFTRGLYCHAPSRLIVHLPKPAHLFEAVAGIDARAGGGTWATCCSLDGLCSASGNWALLTGSHGRSPHGTGGIPRFLRTSLTTTTPRSNCWASRSHTADSASCNAGIFE